MVQMKDWKKDETRANLMKTLQQLDHQPVSADEAIASPCWGCLAGPVDWLL